MEAPDKRLHPSLPANYVTLVDLRERWMQRQKQKKRDDVNGDRDLQRNIEVQIDLGAKGEDKGVGEGDHLEQQQQQPLGKSVVRSNPNPKSAPQRPSHWVQISHPKQKPVFPRVRTIQTGPTPVVQVVEAKTLPVQSKPPPFDAPKVKSVVKPREGHSSGNKVDDHQKLGGPNREEKKKIVPKRNYKDGKFHSPGKEENKLKWNNTRNHEKKDVVQSQPERVVLDPNGDGEDKNIRGRGFVARNVSENVEIEGKFAGVSLSSGTEEWSGGRSVVVRNRNGWIKGRHGGFEGGVMKERTKRESGSGLVWVKKGEASKIGDAPIF